MGSTNRGETITRQGEPQSEISAIGRMAETYYRNLSPDQIADILAMKGEPEAALASLGGFMAHYEGTLKPEEIEQVLAVVEADGENDPHDSVWYRHGVANMLIFKYGDRLSPGQLDRALEGMWSNRLGGWALESLITVHDRQLSAEQLDLMLERWGIHSLRQAVVDRYGAELRPERIDTLIEELADAKEEAGERLDRKIEREGPYLDVSNLPAYRYRDDLDEKVRARLLNESCPEIHVVLASIAKNCAANLSPEQIDRLDDLGNALVSAHLITYCWENMSSARQEELQSAPNALSVFYYLVDCDLPLPVWREGLIGNAIDQLGDHNRRGLELLIAEPYVDHLSDSNIEKLIKKEAFAKYLFKHDDMHYPETVALQARMDVILKMQGSELPPRWLTAFADRLSPEHAALIRDYGRPQTVGYLIENYPELLPEVTDLDARISLLLEKAVGYVSAEWIERYHRHLSSDQVDEIVDSHLGVHGGGVIVAITRHCSEKVSPERIRKISKYYRDYKGEEIRPLLVEFYWPHYLENFNGWVAGTHFHAEFLRQHADKLSETQIEEWLQKVNIFTMESFIIHCGPRLRPAQVDRCWDVIRDNGSDDSLYMRVSRYESEKKLFRLLIEKSGASLTEARVSQLIRLDERGKYCSVLLNHHPDSLSPQNEAEIIRRFGHSHHRVALGADA